MLRFSLRWLLVFIAFVAVGIVSLRYASFAISSCLKIAWFGLLMVAICGVAYRSERQRAFWFGCCVFGWSFAAYAHLVSGDTEVDRAIQSFYDSVTWSVPAAPAIVQEHRHSGGFFEGSGLFLKTCFPRFHPFTSASRSLLGIMVALAGGLIAQWFHATRNPKSRETVK